VAEPLWTAAHGGAARHRTVPLSQTQFEGLGIGYRFIVDEKGIATDLVETHNSGESRFPRQK